MFDESIRVGVVEDHPAYRFALEQIIAATPGLLHVASAADGPDAIELISTVPVDLAILDIELPTIDGIHVLRELAAREVEVRSLIVSAHTEGSLVHEALVAGASGFVSKDTEVNEMRDAIRRCATGGTVMSPEVQDRLSEHIRICAAAEAKRAHITNREREILVLVAAGLSTPEIAKHLYLSQPTVKTHLARAFVKLEVSDRTAAVVEALRAGIIDLGCTAQRPARPLTHAGNESAREEAA